MNSQELKGENHETYERFFSKNETVVSGCFSMPWSNELIDHLSHFPLVRSKLPLRCYVGFNKRAEDGVVLDTVIQYEGMERGFVEKRWGEVFSMKESMEAQLSQYLKSIGAEGGYSISLLSEVARGRSIGFTETIFATLSYGIHHLESSGDAETGAASGISEKSVIDLAWTLSLTPRSGNTIAQGIRNSLSDCPNPIAYFSEPFTAESGLDVRNLKRWEVDIATLSWNKTDHHLPLDYWIVYSGTPGDSRSIEEIRQSDIIESERISNFLWRLSENLRSRGIPESSNATMGTYETFRNVKAHLNYRSIELFDRIYRYGWADESSVGAFVRNIDHYRKLLAMVSEQGPFAEKFIHECQKNLCIDNPVIGITPLYSGKHGGSYLVVAQRGAVRDAVEYATMRISESFPGAEILYRSAKDGTCSGGIEILKDYRETASGEATRVVYVDTAGKKRFCGYIEALSDTSENLIFDAIGRKIYFRWERLTSKEIPSQNAASDLFEKLIESPGEEISNASLPASSYSKNRNEMVSKIISPLSKFVRERFSANLPVRCVGSLTDFRIVLDRGDVTLWLIKRV